MYTNETTSGRRRRPLMGPRSTPNHRHERLLVGWEWIQLQVSTPLQPVNRHRVTAYPLPREPHSTQVQIRFFITVLQLQQMARADPMTALLSPAVGGSMQSQMEAKLASMSLKSPGLKSTMPSFPFNSKFCHRQPQSSIPRL